MFLNGFLEDLKFRDSVDSDLSSVVTLIASNDLGDTWGEDRNQRLIVRTNKKTSNKTNITTKFYTISYVLRWSWNTN